MSNTPDPVPKNSPANPKEVLKKLIAATGISEDLIESEITHLSQRAGLNPQALSIEDLRHILADYVQDVLLSAKEEFGSQNQAPNHTNLFTTK